MSFLSRLFGGSDTMSPTDFVAQRDADAPVLDVRTAREVAGGRLRGAHHADVMAPDFDAMVDHLALPTDGPVYVYCKSGNRSKMAVGLLQRRGVAGAVNVGGYDALVRAGAETEA